ncbi:hypothetical protein MASR2M78_11850 [Treponema sp.]
MLIGLTGAYCAGKNFIGNLLQKRGFKVLDVDKLGHSAISISRELLISQFGKGILARDGSIDRSVLGKIVFSDQEKLKTLEAIIHPIANRMTEDWLIQNKGENLVINAALLHKSSAFKDLDCIILVRAHLLTRLLRARKRDKLAISMLLKRFASQKEFASQYFGKETDIYTVDNRASFGIFAQRSKRKLEQQIDAILAREGMVQ